MGYPMPGYANELDDALSAFDQARGAQPPPAMPPQALATGPFPINGAAEPPPMAAAPMDAPDAAAELPPEPPPRRGGLDPELASFLQRGKGPQMDWSQTAPAPGQSTEDPNRANKIIDAIASGFAGARPGSHSRGYDAGYWQGVDQDRERKQLKARALADADPNSPQSQMMRSRMAPALKSMGLTDAEIGGMSATDIKELGKGGNVVKALINAREKSATEIAKQKQKDADAAAAEKTWTAHNTITSGQQDKRTQTMAGVGAQNAASQAMLTSGLSLRNSQTLADEAEARRIADEKRKAEMAKAKTEEGFVSPDEIESSNAHVTVPNAELLKRTQATSKRQVGDIRNDIKTTERAGHMYDQMIADEAEWSNGSAAAKAQVLSGLPLSDEAKQLATIKARYEAFSTELQGVKSKIAQSAGSAAEREDAKHEIPSIMSPSAHERLVGIGGMLESNSNANLGSFGGKAHIVTKRPAKTQAAAAAAPAPAGMVSVRNPQTGTIKHVPAANADAAVKRGWVVVGG